MMKSETISNSPLPTDNYQMKWAPDLVLRYGVMTAAMLVLFFMAMRAIGLEELLFLHVANLGIFLFGTFLFFRDFYRRFGREELSYFNGLVIGSAMNGFASLVLGIFMLLAMQVLSPGLGEKLLDLFPLANNNLWAVSAVIALEGIFFGFLATFIAMQRFK